MRYDRRSSRWTWMGALLAALLFALTLARADLAGAGERLGSVGLASLVVLIPFPLGLALDTIAWQRLFSVTGMTPRVRTLFAVRLSTEAVNNAMPMGGVFAEALAPVLLARHGIPAHASVATATAKRWLIVRMHGVYVLGALALGGALLLGASRALGLGATLPWVTFVAAAALVLASLLLEGLFARTGVAARLHDALARLPSRRLASALAPHRGGFRAVDAALLALADARATLRGASALLLVQWLVESAEAWLLLSVLGAPAGAAQVLAFEASASVLRSAAFFAPSGLGVQDIGYLALFDGLGLSGGAPVAASFVLLKRAKEVAWIVVGLLVLALVRRAARASDEAGAPPSGGALREVSS